MAVRVILWKSKWRNNFGKFEFVQVQDGAGGATTWCYYQLCLSAGQGCEDQVHKEMKPIKQPNEKWSNRKSTNNFSVRPGCEDQAHWEINQMKHPIKNTHQKIQ